MWHVVTQQIQRCSLIYTSIRWKPPQSIIPTPPEKRLLDHHIRHTSINTPTALDFNTHAPPLPTHERPPTQDSTRDHRTTDPGLYCAGYMHETSDLGLACRTIRGAPRRPKEPIYLTRITAHSSREALYRSTYPPFILLDPNTRRRIYHQLGSWWTFPSKRCGPCFIIPR
jgi:hypothetical protein